jgi:hypothetical protein
MMADEAREHGFPEGPQARQSRTPLQNVTGETGGRRLDRRPHPDRAIPSTPAHTGP